jgi:hypothetical protein
VRARRARGSPLSPARHVSKLDRRFFVRVARQINGILIRRFVRVKCESSVYLGRMGESNPLPTGWAAIWPGLTRLMVGLARSPFTSREQATSQLEMPIPPRSTHTPRRWSLRTISGRGGNTRNSRRNYELSRHRKIVTGTANARSLIKAGQRHNGAWANRNYSCAVRLGLFAATFLAAPGRGATDQRYGALPITRLFAPTVNGTIRDRESSTASWAAICR